ncbi:unnamed protein product [Vitrella brassicaformis CCMP3155]|uniref:Uncharacterized protein n=1 Tax=Vitrella brassicaformis (strain CCMP3155) TaxID=1169540 RepID=A0A0G4F3W2_VITBC|nr:unnamed protein product [Vitrella brassicaformis CCMP3155]|eukprot:CEM06395.1 unnamed protein product [Vitrella brassicaformis CCMP3155]
MQWNDRQAKGPRGEKAVAFLPGTRDLEDVFEDPSKEYYVKLNGQRRYLDLRAIPILHHWLISFILAMGERQVEVPGGGRAVAFLPGTRDLVPVFESLFLPMRYYVKENGERRYFELLPPGVRPRNEHRVRYDAAPTAQPAAQPVERWYLEQFFLDLFQPYLDQKKRAAYESGSWRYLPWVFLNFLLTLLVVGVLGVEIGLERGGLRLALVVV